MSNKEIKPQDSVLSFEGQGNFYGAYQKRSSGNFNLEQL